MIPLSPRSISSMERTSTQSSRQQNAANAAACRVSPGNGLSMPRGPLTTDPSALREVPCNDVRLLEIHTGWGKRSSLRSSGKARRYTPTTTRQATPPTVTARTGPHHAAVRPDSNSPSSLDAPMNMALTAPHQFARVSIVAIQEEVRGFNLSFIFQRENEIDR